MTIHKKIDTFSNLNQKVVSLNVLQEFMDTISEEKSTDEKIRTAGEILKYTTEFITVMPFGLNRYQSAVIAPP